MTDQTSASEKLAEAVTKRGNVRLDVNKLTEHAVARLDMSLDKAVAPRAERIETALSGYEQRLAGLGTEPVDAVAAKTDEVMAKVGQVEQRVTKLGGSLTWDGMGRMALALVPFALVLWTLGQVLGLVGMVFGVGPLFGWLWSCFEHAEAWYWKGLIALGTLGLGAAIVWVVVQVGGWLHKQYRGW